MTFVFYHFSAYNIILFLLLLVLFLFLLKHSFLLYVRTKKRVSTTFALLKDMHHDTKISVFVCQVISQADVNL